MKRDDFLITYRLDDGQMQTVVKHTWNAANKEVVSIIRQIARNQGQMYEVIQSESERASDYYDGFIKGTRTWQGRSTGQKVFFLKLKGLIKMQNIKIEEIYIGAEKLKRNMKGESNV